MAKPRGDSEIVLGVITGAHGIRGAVRIKSFTGVPEAIAGYGPLSSAAGMIEIRRMQPAKSGFIAELKGVTDRDQAEALAGLKLSLPRHALPAPDEDEFYHADLIGLAVRHPDGAVFGEIKGIHDFGAGDLLEIRRADTGQSEWIPFTQEAVPTIDIASGHVVIKPLEAET